jgi:hypothetical protein
VIVLGAAATSDWLAFGAPAVPVAVNVTGLPVRPLEVAVSVLVPAVVPSVHDVTAAMPLPFVVTGVVGVTVPPPDATAKVTATPATGLLNWSRTITEGGVTTAVPTVAVWAFPALMAREAAAPVVPVAVKVTGLPARPLDVAVRVFVPAVVPSVHDVTAAMPLPLVVTGVEGLTVPPPEATANVTATPATGLLNWSRTITDGGVVTAVPTVAVWAFPALIAIALAAAALTVTVAVCVTVTAPFTVAVTVFVPATVALSDPVIWPLAFVVPTGCVSVLPVPVAASTTVVPLTGLPAASFTVTVMVETLAPELAVIVLGAAATSDWLAFGAPAVPVAVNVTGLPVRPLKVAVSVLVPAVVPRVHDVTTAIPPASVLTGVVGFTVPPPEATANVTTTPATGLLN